jgi:phospholipase C
MDHFFQAAFGYFWLICGCSPFGATRMTICDHTWITVMRRSRARKAAVNTVQSVFVNDGKQGEVLLPDLRASAIGDALTAKYVNWRWYAGGWVSAVNQKRSTEQDDMLVNVFRFQWHHQPFTYFERFNPDTEKGRAERDRHLKGEAALPKLV